MIAAVALVVAAGVLVAAYLALDGTRVLEDVWQRLTVEPASTPVADAADSPVSGSGLVLPAGMPEEFALRLWQEQLDSQGVITQLVDGEVVSLRVTKVERDGTEARLYCVITLQDGSSVTGVIGMREYGGTWYVSYASATDDGQPASAPTSSLPTVSEVDTQLLNTIIAQQTKSADVTQEYVDGKIESVSVKTITMGPNTATISLEMDEDHEEGYADFVAVRQRVDGEDVWFLARFTKTLSGSEQ